MADNDDRETDRQEYLFGQLKLTMKDERTRTKIFNRLCGAPIRINIGLSRERFIMPTWFQIFLWSCLGVIAGATIFLAVN